MNAAPDDRGRRQRPEVDALADAVTHALDQGWFLVPQLAFGVCDNALTRTLEHQITDIVTIPSIGESTVVRLRGGPSPDQPRRTGHELWRHHVAPDLALSWVLSDPDNDDALNRQSTDTAERGEIFPPT